MVITQEEEQRLGAVARTSLLDRPEEERFRRIVRLVQRHFDANVCSITLVDRDRQFFVSQKGLACRETPRSESVCSLVVGEKVPLVVSDLSAYEPTQCFHDLIYRQNYHFYAGVPLWSPDGWPLGTLCILDHETRNFGPEDLDSLIDFAAIVEDEIAVARVDRTNHDLLAEVERLRLRAFVDALTGVWNRGAVFELLHRERERAQRGTKPLSVAMLDIDFFKNVNDTHGHAAGDEVLKELCVRLKGAVRPYDAVGRYGGEEFVVVFPETVSEEAVMLGERLRSVIADTAFELPNLKLPITISVGLGTTTGEDDTVEDLLSRADSALYKAKRTGRNRVVSG